MVCGHIDADVRAIADDLLPPPEPGPEARAPQDPPEPSFVLRRGREATTDTLLGIEEVPGLFAQTETHESVAVPAQAEQESSGDSEDWGLDDDAADYSAAV
jgi:hypothetical protein